MFLLIPIMLPILVAFVILVSPKWPVTRQGTEKVMGNYWRSDYSLQQYLKEHRVRFFAFVAITMVLSLIVSGFLFWLGNRKVYDKEVWHFKVTKIQHEEKWTTHETRTETYTTGSGKNQQTHTRTVHYTEEHGPYWTKHLENGENQRIDAGEYANWRKVWANEKKVGEHKGSSAGLSRAITGGIFDCVWPDTFETIYPHGEVHSYKWKVRYSESALRDIGEPTEELVKKYPRPAEQRNTAPLMSYEGVSLGGDADLLLRRVNAVLGPRKQVHTLLVLFKGSTPRTVVDDVLKAWQMPNKNELVTFVALDSNTVKWCEVHSWIDNTALHGDLETAFMGEPFTAQLYADTLLELVPKGWNRKHASEFDYLEVDLHWGWGFGTFLLSIVIVIVGYFIVDRWDIFQDGDIRFGSRIRPKRYDDYHSFRRRKNFTLIELLVVLVIVAIVISMIVSVVSKFI